MYHHNLKIGIDCFNINSGGGATHLLAFLEEVNNINSIKAKKINMIIWAPLPLLNKIKNYSWLKKENNYFLNKNIIFRLFWHIFLLKNEIKKFKINLLFCPGGICLSYSVPNITMFRNVLPYLENEIIKYNFFKRIRLKVLRFVFSYSLKNTDGIIYLSDWAKNFLKNKIDLSEKKNAIIPHGVVQRSRLRKNEKYKVRKNTLKILYISHTSPYKNHDYVLRNILNFSNSIKETINFISIGAICDNFNVKLWSKLIGKKLNLKFLGDLNHNQIVNHILKADFCIFASSAENFPNVLLEYMSVGSVCFCNNIEPMKSILGNSGVFFDIKEENDLQSKLKLVLKNPYLQEKLKMLSFKKSQNYTWESTTKLTLRFFYKVGLNSSKDV